MNITQVTTPAGHRAELRCEYDISSTYVEVRLGGITVRKRSELGNDVALIPLAMRTFDDLITNLRAYQPTLVDDNDGRAPMMLADD